MLWSLSILKEIVSDQVGFSYEDSRHVLHDINLTIAKGETVAFVGPSGAGKTTICSLLPRFYEVDGGTIRIDGVDIRKYTQESLRRQMGSCSRTYFCFPARFARTFCTAN